MTSYVCHLTDRQGTRLGQVPPESLTYESRLGGGGAASLKIRLDHPAISGVNQQNLDTWATELDVIRDGALCFSGPIVDLEAAGEDESVTVKAAAATQWLARREIRRDLMYVDDEQTEILAALVAYAQDPAEKGPHADARLNVATGVTGVTRTRAYLGAERKVLLEAAQEFTAAADGFDLILELSLDGDVARRTLRPAFPYAGIDTDVPLILGQGGLTGLTVKRPGDPVTTRINAIGNGEGSSQVTADAFADPDLEERYGVHEGSLSHLDVKEAATLLALASDALRLRRPPLQVTGVSYKVTAATPYNLAELGDRVPVLARRGWLQIDERLRVVGRKVTVSPTGDELVDLTTNSTVETA